MFYGQVGGACWEPEFLESSREPVRTLAQYRGGHSHTAQGLYILPRSMGNRHSRSHNSRRLWGRWCFGVQPPGLAAVCGSPPPEPTPASPVQGRPGAAGVWGPPPSPPGLPPLSVCHCPAQRPPAHSFAQGLLRGLNPGPGGQQGWAGDIPVARLPWITRPVQLASYGGPGHAIFSVMG